MRSQITLSFFVQLLFFLDTQNRERENSKASRRQVIFCKLPHPPHPLVPIAYDRSYICLRKANWEIVSPQSHLGLFISPRPQPVKIVRRYNVKRSLPREEVD